MTPEESKKNDYELVREQVERAKRERSVSAEITVAGIKKWYEEKHKERWIERADRGR